MATKPTDSEAQSTEESATEVTPSEPKTEAKPSAHAGFDKNGKCQTCNEKIRTDSDNQIICPINHPKCPRNKKK